MAKVISITNMAAVFICSIVVAILSDALAVTAQDTAAPSPSPSMITGSAFGLPISSVLVCSSLLLSLLALLKH
ncbi:hypothetical protein BVC80_1309g11 [Macleaya cordata]|uniref:Uncharacterized protein n=1 Tax=Macleaya cordata TaxID=56857 RepID=A0A200R396_MACCD|nr:hypothetical protein BVC80_1309g11 [Macleaya cordata]